MDGGSGGGSGVVVVGAVMWMVVVVVVVVGLPLHALLKVSMVYIFLPLDPMFYQTSVYMDDPSTSP